MKSAMDFMPEKLSMTALRNAAKNCRGCHLYKNATQTVFGEGAKKSSIMIVGEIPGEKEDEIGKPFVGPAGKFLSKSLEKSKLNMGDIYFTNVVKHFKFNFVNNRKLHRSPVSFEIKACIPWLHAEIKVIKPKIIVCLGATAAKNVLDKKFLITKQRGKWFDYAENSAVIVTFHPAAILRAPDEVERHRMKKIFIKDIKKVALFLSRKL